MILYDLKCADGHVFEAWFRNGDAYDEQAAAGHIACVVCGDTRIGKAPMAPHLGRSRTAEAPRAEGRGGDGPNEQQIEVMRQLRALRSKIESDFDYVGTGFAEEARKIHYGEVERRGIYGEASDEQSKALAEEGIEVAKVPWIPRGDA